MKSSKLMRFVCREIVKQGPKHLYVVRRAKNCFYGDKLFDETYSHFAAFTSKKEAKKACGKMNILYKLVRTK